MMISLLKKVLYKSAAQDTDPKAEAMAGAAAVAKPSWAPAMPDFTKGKQSEDAQAPDLTKEVENKDKEIERLKNEKRIVEQNLQFEQIKSKQNEASRQLELQERQMLDKIRQELQKLDQKKILAQADEVKHQSVLAKLESDSLLRIQLDKNKSIMDLHNQLLKMQMQHGDLLMKQRMQHADLQMKLKMQIQDKAKADADKYKEDAKKQIEQLRQEMHKLNLNARQGISPALNSTMSGAIKTLGLFGKPKKFTLPKPGSAPKSVNIIDPKSRLQEKVAAVGNLDYTPGDGSLLRIDNIRQAASIPTARGLLLVQLPTNSRQPTGQALAYSMPALRSAALRMQQNTNRVNTNPNADLFGEFTPLVSLFMGSMFGPAFNFYKKVNKYDLVNKNDRRADMNQLVAAYTDDAKISPAILRRTGNEYTSPGLQRNWDSLLNSSDNRQF